MRRGTAGDGVEQVLVPFQHLSCSSPQAGGRGVQEEGGGERGKIKEGGKSIHILKRGQTGW